jgi:hypothetical protein
VEGEHEEPEAECRCCGSREDERAHQTDALVRSGWLVGQVETAGIEPASAIA